MAQAQRTPTSSFDSDPEWGNLRGVRERFGLSHTFIYKLLREGLIRSVLAKSPGSLRGARLFSYPSIRSWLNSLPEDDRAVVDEMQEGRDRAIERRQRQQRHRKPSSAS